MGERVGSDVLDDPGRVARAAVKGGCQGAGRSQVGDGPWEAVLEEAIRVDRRRYGRGLFGYWDGDG